MVKRRDFQKVAAQIHEFLLKLSEETECAELRDALNLTLLQMQRYYRLIRNRSQIIDQSINASGSPGAHGILSRSLRGMSPMTPFRDAPDKFIWKWVDLENVRAGGATLPASLDKEEITIPSVIRAARQGDNNLLLQLLEKDPDSASAKDALSRSAVVYAVHFSCLDTLQLLLEQGADVNSVANDGSTAVHRACHNGNHEALQILIQYDADLTVQDVRGRAPIHWTCTTKSRECLKILIDRGVEVGVRDDDGLSPSMWACRLDHIEHFDLLSSIQAQQQQQSRTLEEEDGLERDNASRTWMHWSVRRTEPLECLKTLLTEESACLKDEDGKTVLHVAAEQGSLPSVKVILEIAGKECLEQRDNCNRTPLILATMGGHGEVVNCLLAEGADLACVDNLGATAWDYAAAKQLHYCLLIIASYIRQRGREQEALNNEQKLNSAPDEELGFKQLQINTEVENGSSNFLLNEPHPPSTRPPATPRTPRTPRRNGFPPLQSLEDSRSVDESPKYSGPSSHRSSPSSRSGGPPQKRSPSTPMDEDEEVHRDRGIDQEISVGSKRMKSDIKHPGEREQISSGNSSRSSIMHHSPSHNSSHSINSENRPANFSQGVDDDASVDVSIDVMDVSDFESEERQSKGLDVTDNDQDVLPSPRPPMVPRTKNSGSPERRPAGRRHQGGTMENAGKPVSAYTIPHAQPSDDIYDGDYEDEDKKYSGSRNHGNKPGDYPGILRDSPEDARIPSGQDPSRDCMSVDTKASPETPHHLMPLPGGNAPLKKKKKKKVQAFNMYTPTPQPHSYVAPTQPQYPSSHQPPPLPRTNRSPSSRVKSSTQPSYLGENEGQSEFGRGSSLNEDSGASVDMWQRPTDEFDNDGKAGLMRKSQNGSWSNTGRGQKYSLQNGEMSRIPSHQQQQMTQHPVNPAGPRTRHPSADDVQKPPLSPRRISSANDVSRSRNRAPQKNDLPPPISNQRRSSAKRQTTSFSSFS